MKYVVSRRGAGDLWEEVTCNLRSKRHPGAKHGRIWRKNILGRGRLRVALGLNVQKLSEGHHAATGGTVR